MAGSYDENNSRGSPDFYEGNFDPEDDEFKLHDRDPKTPKGGDFVWGAELEKSNDKVDGASDPAVNSHEEADRQSSSVDEQADDQDSNPSAPQDDNQRGQEVDSQLSTGESLNGDLVSHGADSDPLSGDSSALSETGQTVSAPSRRGLILPSVPSNGTDQGQDFNAPRRDQQGLKLPSATSKGADLAQNAGDGPSSQRGLRLPVSSSNGVGSSSQGGLHLPVSSNIGFDPYPDAREGPSNHVGLPHDAFSNGFVQSHSDQAQNAPNFPDQQGQAALGPDVAQSGQIGQWNPELTGSLPPAQYAGNWEIPNDFTVFDLPNVAGPSGAVPAFPNGTGLDPAGGHDLRQEISVLMALMVRALANPAGMTLEDNARLGRYFASNGGLDMIGNILGRLRRDQDNQGQEGQDASATLGNVQEVEFVATLTSQALVMPDQTIEAEYAHLGRFFANNGGFEQISSHLQRMQHQPPVQPQQPNGFANPPPPSGNVGYQPQPNGVQNAHQYFPYNVAGHVQDQQQHFVQQMPGQQFGNGNAHVQGPVQGPAQVQGPPQAQGPAVNQQALEMVIHVAPPPSGQYDFPPIGPPREPNSVGAQLLIDGPFSEPQFGPQGEDLPGLPLKRQMGLAAQPTPRTDDEQTEAYTANYVYGKVPPLAAWGPNNVFTYPGEHPGTRVKKLDTDKSKNLRTAQSFTTFEIAAFIAGSPQLKMWVQQSPSQINARTKEADHLCRWSKCPVLEIEKISKIGPGWFRVAFDQFPWESTHGYLDPFIPAFAMHLWCFEQAFNPVYWHQQGILQPDDRALSPGETKPKANIDRDTDKKIVEEAYLPWFRAHRDENQGPGQVWMPRDLESSLSYKLTNHKIDNQPEARRQNRRRRNSGKGNNLSIDYHRGDLRMFVEMRKTRRQEGRPHFDVDSNGGVDPNTQPADGSGDVDAPGSPMTNFLKNEGLVPDAPVPENQAAAYTHPDPANPAGNEQMVGDNQAIAPNGLDLLQAYSQTAAPGLYQAPGGNRYPDDVYGYVSDDEKPQESTQTAPGNPDVASNHAADKHSTGDSEVGAGPAINKRSRSDSDEDNEELGNTSSRRSKRGRN